jgi:hypothetical protein
MIQKNCMPLSRRPRWGKKSSRSLRWPDFMLDKIIKETAGAPKDGPTRLILFFTVILGGQSVAQQGDKGEETNAGGREKIR